MRALEIVVPAAESIEATVTASVILPPSRINRLSPWVRENRFELSAPDNQTGMLPLHHPAILKVKIQRGVPRYPALLRAGHSRLEFYIVGFFGCCLINPIITMYPSIYTVIFENNAGRCILDYFMNATEKSVS